jgi:hypothetical protein
LAAGNGVCLAVLLVEHLDAYIVQQGASRGAILQGLGRMEGEDRPALFRFGIREPFRRLLDLDAQLGGKVTHHMAHLPTRIQQRCYDPKGEDRGQGHQGNA